MSVLVWHYQHFYFVGTRSEAIKAHRDIQPFFPALEVLYTHGYLAVQFFWILSGFVFLHVYRAKPETPARTFFAHRFARLYPLHVITLCLVAVLQWYCRKSIGGDQIYGFNDLRHFILNLFFASYWGLQKGFSFNAPIWSVSVEVVVYVVFFLILKSVRLSVATCIVWAVVSHQLRRYSANLIFECSELFAIGGLVNLVAAGFESSRVRWLGLAVPASLLAMFVAGVATARMEIARSASYLLFPALILLAVGLENRRYSLGRLGDAVGNITYSSYLIHVPIQLLIIIGMKQIPGMSDIVSSRLFFVGYLAFVLGTAFVVYRRVELPLKRWLLALATR